MLQSFVTVREHLDASLVEPARIRGRVIASREILDLLHQLADESCCDQVVRHADKLVSLKDIEADESIEVDLHPRNVQGGQYNEWLDEFVRRNQSNPPGADYYIHEIGYKSWTNVSKPVQVEQYEAVVNFVAALRKGAKYVSDDEFVFIGSQALVLVPKYSFSDLPSDFAGLRKLTQHVETPTQHEERMALLVSVMTDMVGNVANKFDRFRLLLADLNGLLDAYFKSHDLYLEQFSFHKVKAELDKEILDLGDKIQGVINDAQTKLIAVPAAFVLLVASFDFEGRKLALNVGLVATSFIFAVLIQILLANQFASLDFIKDKIDRFETTIDDEKKGVLRGSLTGFFTKIKDRRISQKRLLVLLSILVWISWLLSLVFLIYSFCVRFDSLAPLTRIAFLHGR